MEIEVVAGQVREDCDRERNPPDSSLVKRVR